MLVELFAVIAPVLFGVDVGYVRARLGRAYPTEFVLCIALSIGSLCLILATLTHTRVNLHSSGRVALVSVLTCACTAALGWAVTRLGCQEWQVLVSTYNFPNIGSMGLLACPCVFGETGMTLAVAFYPIISIGNSSLGMLRMNGERFWRSPLGNPILFSVLLALLLTGFDLQLPCWMMNTVDLMAGLITPLMLVTLDVSLAGTHPRQLGNGFFYGGLCLLLGALMGQLVTLAPQSPPLAQGALVMQSSMPVVVFNHLYALRGNRLSNQIASLVPCPTLLPFASTPPLLTWWLPALHWPRDGAQHAGSRMFQRIRLLRLGRIRMIAAAKTMRLACRHPLGCSFNIACLLFLLSGDCLLCTTTRRSGLPRGDVLSSRPGISDVDLPFERLHESV